MKLNKRNKLKWMFINNWYKHFRAVTKMLNLRRLNTEIVEEKKQEFEKDIVKILKKYGLFASNENSLQHVEIIVDVDEYPKVKMHYMLGLERSDNESKEK